MWLFNSSTSPMACGRPLFLETRVLSPRPVVPSSPVRVAICVRRLPIKNSSLNARQRAVAAIVRYMVQANVGAGNSPQKSWTSVGQVRCNGRMLNLPRSTQMPSNHRHLHAFDLRSVVLFTSLTLGGTTAVFAQAAAPSSPDASAQPTLTAKALTPSEVFMRSDVNRDGQLSRAEAENLPSVSRTV